MGKITYVKGVFVDWRSYFTNIEGFLRYHDNFQRSKMADVIS